MKTHLSWRFPLFEPGCGINLGNGTLGHGLGQRRTRRHGAPRTGAMLSRPTVAGEIIILRPA